MDDEGVTGKRRLRIILSLLNKSADFSNSPRSCMNKKVVLENLILIDTYIYAQTRQQIKPFLFTIHSYLNNFLILLHIDVSVMLKHPICC